MLPTAAVNGPNSGPAEKSKPSRDGKPCMPTALRADGIAKAIASAKSSSAEGKKSHRSEEWPHKAQHIEALLCGPVPFDQLRPRACRGSARLRALRVSAGYVRPV